MKKSRKNLIITADDFGISQLANKNILLLARAGKLDRVAIMTNGKFTQKEITALKKSGVKLDIHLDLDNQISDKRKMKAGAFSRGIIFSIKYLSGRIGSHANKLHWEKQLEKFYELFNKYPDGINSHQHIHFFPPYFKVVANLAKKNNIEFIRFGKKGISKNSHKIRFILSWLRTKNLAVFSLLSLTSSDFMLSLDWIKNLSEFLENLPDGKTEIVCHPERKEEFELIQKYF